MANLLLLDNLTPHLLAQIAPGNLMAPESNSTFADWTDLTRLIIDLITLVFFVAIIAVMVYFALKYRRTDDRAHAEHTSHHNTALELSWTLPPLGIVLVLFYMGFVGYWNMVTPPADAYEIQVTAKKWSWNFTHPNGYQSNILDVPAGRPVKLIMRSDDVLHSLYVPAFRVKKDVVPGRYSQLWFEAIDPTPNADYELPTGDQLDADVKEQLTAEARASLTTDEGAPTQEQVDAKVAEMVAALGQLDDDTKKKITEKHGDDADAVAKATSDAIVAAKQKIAKRKYDLIAAENGHQLFCTEFCGNSHSDMLAKVVVHSSDWQPPAFGEGMSQVELGQLLFGVKGCRGCHADQQGMPSQCPPLFGGIAGQQRSTSAGTVTADENYLRESILNPGAKIVQGYGNVMPVIKMSDEHVDAIIAYLKTLGGDPTSGQSQASE